MWASIKRFFSPNRESRTGENPPPSPDASAHKTDQFFADEPLKDQGADQFGRSQFASRISQTITRNNDASSAVITISGKYGEGKSTVLSFIKQQLEHKDNVVVVSFNPWRFASEESLLIGYFMALSSALQQRFRSVKENVGKVIEDYGLLATQLVKINYQGFEVAAGGALPEIGRRMAATSIDQRKERIEELLLEERKRVVIIMDDIDRLERSEVHSVFRLIKLTANFPYTTYLLAFDYDLVAESIGERFGKGDVAAGRSFLEKLVQVPLQLPKATHEDLVTYCLQHVSKVLDNTFSLTEDQIREFQIAFHQYLSPRLGNPRAVKRYANALLFALPALQGELNPVDVMLLEALKVFYPATHEHLRDFPHMYTGHHPFIELAGERERQTAWRVQIVDRSGLSGVEIENLWMLLERLFPQLRELWRRGEYGQGDEGRWVTEQRVSSHTYLLRYLSFSVPSSDYSDRELDLLLTGLAEQTDLDAVEALHAALLPDKVRMFLDKVSRKARSLNAEPAARLAFAISANGRSFGDSRGEIPFATPRHQAAILIRQLVLRQPTIEARINLAKRVLECGAFLPFLWWCWSYLQAIGNEEQTGIDTETFEDLGKIVAKRVADEARESSLFECYPDDHQDLLHMWAIHGSGEEVQQYVKEMLAANGALVATVLRQNFIKRAGHELDFRHKHYEDLSRIVDPTIIYDVLVTEVPTLADASYSIQSAKFDDSILQCQFAAIHRERSNPPPA